MCTVGKCTAQLPLPDLISKSMTQVMHGIVSIDFERESYSGRDDIMRSILSKDVKVFSVLVEIAWVYF